VFLLAVQSADKYLGHIPVAVHDVALIKLGPFVLLYLSCHKGIQSANQLFSLLFLRCFTLHCPSRVPIQVSSYLLGEYGHLLARRPGCSPKELFTIINDRLPTVSTSTIAIILSSYAKILMHTQPPDAGLQQQILTIFKKHESYIDVEIQQRAVEYFELSKKGAALADVLAEMPKFPERESALLKKAEDAEVDTAEQSAIKLRSQQQTSSALVLADHPPVNGSAPAANHLTLVKMPSQNVAEESNASYEETVLEAPKENGAPVEVESKVEIITETAAESKVVPPTSHSPSQADLLADLLGPLAIEGPPAAVEQNPVQGLEANESPVGDLALATLEDQSNSVQPIVNVEEKFHVLCTKDSGVLYEDTNIQVRDDVNFVPSLEDFLSLLP
jgi:AP-2 complex subunit alpha